MTDGIACCAVAAFQRRRGVEIATARSYRAAATAARSRRIGEVLLVIDGGGSVRVLMKAVEQEPKRAQPLAAMTWGCTEYAAVQVRGGE